METWFISFWTLSNLQYPWKLASDSSMKSKDQISRQSIKRTNCSLIIGRRFYSRKITIRLWSRIHRSDQTTTMKYHRIQQQWVSPWYGIFETNNLYLSWYSLIDDSSPRVYVTSAVKMKTTWVLIVSTSSITTRSLNKIVSKSIQ